MGSSFGPIANQAHVKAADGEWDGHAENQHFCLLLARKLGLVVPYSNVRRFGRKQQSSSNDTTVSEAPTNGSAYTRMKCVRGPEPLPRASRKIRVVPESSKLWPAQRELQQFAARWRSFLDAIAFNWLIAGTDAHAKKLRTPSRRARCSATRSALRPSKRSAKPRNRRE